MWAGVVKTPDENFSTTGRNFLAQCPRIKEQTEFLQTDFFLEMFLETCEMEFCQVLRRFIDKRSKFYFSTSENFRKKMSFYEKRIP